MAKETLQELLLQRLAELERERGMRLTLRQVARRSLGSVTADTLRVLVIGEPLRLTDVQCRGRPGVGSRGPGGADLSGRDGLVGLTRVGRKTTVDVTAICRQSGRWSATTSRRP